MHSPDKCKVGVVDADLTALRPGVGAVVRGEIPAARAAAGPPDVWERVGPASSWLHGADVDEGGEGALVDHGDLVDWAAGRGLGVAVVAEPGACCVALDGDVVLKGEASIVLHVVPNVADARLQQHCPPRTSMHARGSSHTNE
jgi:hypothetical protein